MLQRFNEMFFRKFLCCRDQKVEELSLVIVSFYYFVWVHASFIAIQGSLILNVAFLTIFSVTNLQISDWSSSTAMWSDTHLVLRMNIFYIFNYILDFISPKCSIMKWANTNFVGRIFSCLHYQLWMCKYLSDYL